MHLLSASSVSIFSLKETKLDVAMILHTPRSNLAVKSVTFTQFNRSIWVQGGLNTWGVGDGEWAMCINAQQFPCIIS